MRRMLAIACKEWTVYFITPMAWVIFTAMAFLSSYLFINLLEEFRRAQQFARDNGLNQIPHDMRNVTDGIVVSLFELILLLLLLLSPFLSMRLFSEEKRNRTLELLMTAPVRPFEIVLGKFLGGLGAIASLLAVTVIYPLMLSWLSTAESGQPVEWATVSLGYFALLLWGATCLSLGMFFSSLSTSQVSSAIMTLGVLLPWTLLGWFAQTVEEPLRGILNGLSFQNQMGGLLRGTADLSALTYLFSITCFFLFSTHLRLSGPQWSVEK